MPTPDAGEPDMGGDGSWVDAHPEYHAQRVEVPGGSLIEKDRLAEAFMKQNMLQVLVEGEQWHPKNDDRLARIMVLRTFQAIINSALVLWHGDSDAFFLDYAALWRADFKEAARK